MTKQELNKVLELHKLWLQGDPKGKRANLSGAYLTGAYLSEANLYGANLSEANLSEANLSEANLSEAYLYGANLSGAYLYGANLSGANLSGANLSGADLTEAYLYGANLTDTKMPIECEILPQEGSFIAWKAASKCILKIEIPKNAKRISCYTSRKCRASKIKVLAIYNKEGKKTKKVKAEGLCNHGFTYRIGQIIDPDSFDPDRRIVCSHGIHFFLTKQEALDWLKQY